MLSLHNYRYLIDLVEQGRLSAQGLLRQAYYSGGKLDNSYVDSLVESGLAYGYEPEEEELPAFIPPSSL